MIEEQAQSSLFRKTIDINTRLSKVMSAAHNFFIKTTHCRKIYIMLI